MKTWLSPHRLDGDMSHCHTGSLAHLHHLAPGGRTAHLSLSPPTSSTSGENQKKVWTVPLILFQPKQLLFFSQRCYIMCEI